MRHVKQIIENIKLDWEVIPSYWPKSDIVGEVGAIRLFNTFIYKVENKVGVDTRTKFVGTYASPKAAISAALRCSIKDLMDSALNEQVKQITSVVQAAIGDYDILTFKVSRKTYTLVMNMETPRGIETVKMVIFKDADKKPRVSGPGATRKNVEDCRKIARDLRLMKII